MFNSDSNIEIRTGSNPNKLRPNSLKFITDVNDTAEKLFAVVIDIGCGTNIIFSIYTFKLPLGKKSFYKSKMQPNRV